jgi:peroxin-16
MTALVEAYENLLLKNVTTVHSIEGGLRNLTWLLPGRFADAEVASEGCEYGPLVCDRGEWRA